MREYNHDSFDRERPAERTGYVQWIALGAVAVGSIGAIVGMTNCSRPRKNGAMSETTSDSATVTAPHGDKLLGGVI